MGYYALKEVDLQLTVSSVICEHNVGFVFGVLILTNDVVCILLLIILLNVKGYSQNVGKDEQTQDFIVVILLLKHV